jgi:hypothetical protein
VKLLYLSESNLRDRLFIKDLVHNFGFAEKAILIHDSFGGTVKDTRFVTKRISALLSESMIYNNAFSADQRNLVHREAGRMRVDTGLIHRLFPPIQLLILGPVIRGETGPELADPLEMLEATRNAFDIEEVILFTANPMSPLAGKREIVRDEADRERLLSVYEEEAAAIELAHRFRPAWIASPQNYAQ